MKNTTLFRTALLLPIALGFAISAQASNTLVMTEVSATELTYSLNGAPDVTVTATTPNQWSMIFENNPIITTEYTDPLQLYVYWKEQDYATSGEVNMVEFYEYNANNGSVVTITSDVVQDRDNGVTPAPLDNGTPYTFNYPGAYTVTFNDDGDNPDPAPDGGATALLVGISVTALAALRRKLS
jgi:hypothetical protein